MRQLTDRDEIYDSEVMTTTYQKLQRLFSERGYLAIDPDGESCRLIGEAETMRLVLHKENGGQPMTTVFPIARGLAPFAARCGTIDRVFFAGEVRRLMGGVPYQTLHSWDQLGVVVTANKPGVNERREYTYLETFIAVVQ